MINHNDFHAHLDAHPDDWEYRLVYADWLEEQGDPFCETQRWMVANGKCPVSKPSGVTYTPQGAMASNWHHGVWDSGEWYPHLDECHCLPEKIMKLITRTLRYWGLTRHAAELDLHNALVKAGEIVCALIEEEEA